jgi:Uma2 family endonuclease
MRRMAGEGNVKSTSSAKLTYDDFVKFPDDGLRHELIDGEHYVTPAPNNPHQRLVGRMFAGLHAYFATAGIGEAFLSPFDVVLSNHDVVEPDLLVLLSDQADILTRQNVRGAPALVVEVLSPGTKKRDRTIKHQLYDRTGVREYWLVDPDGMSITVCRREDGPALRPVAEVKAELGDVLTSPLLPGFALSATDLFSRLDAPPGLG